ncbi:helix-turn-helix domain-containing protein [Rossellomorea aquimaris]|nr:helix-turn-helix domain-containing protein [Rossellomorea aquimaris]
MDLLFIGLVSFSILLLVISFFQRDRYRDIEKDIEELSMNVLQEHYQLKKRMRVLEEELMVNGDAPLQRTSPVRNPIHEVVKNQVIALYQQGIPVEQIAKQSALSKSEVQQLISKLQH